MLVLINLLHAPLHICCLFFSNTRLKRVRRLALYDISGANTLFSLSVSVFVCATHTVCRLYAQSRTNSS